MQQLKQIKKVFPELNQYSDAEIITLSKRMPKKKEKKSSSHYKYN